MWNLTELSFSVKAHSRGRRRSSEKVNHSTVKLAREKLTFQPNIVITQLHGTTQRTIEWHSMTNRNRSTVNEKLFCLQHFVMHVDDLKRRKNYSPTSSTYPICAPHSCVLKSFTKVCQSSFRVVVVVRRRVYWELFWKNPPHHSDFIFFYIFGLLLLVGRYFEPLIMWHTELIALSFRRRLW